MPEYWWKSDELKERPWMGPRAVAYLEGLLSPDFEVLEHGSGGSTLWFAQRVAKVTAVENDPEWMKKVAELAPGSVTIKLSEVLPRFRRKFDLLLIDGVPVEARIAYMREALKLVRPGGFVVLDNANRPEYAPERKALQLYLILLTTVNSNEGGAQYLITDFYQVPEGS
jgi:predicted O-methyltransferase YrrM